MKTVMLILPLKKTHTHTHTQNQWLPGTIIEYCKKCIGKAPEAVKAKQENTVKIFVCPLKTTFTN